MASLSSLQEKANLAKNIVGTVVNDTPVAIRIRYAGTGTVTSVTVDTTDDITLVSVEDGTTTTEEYLFSTYTTMGALAEAISNSAYWDARVVDALRADLTASSPFVDDATVDLSSDGYYDALVDTSVSLNLTYRSAQFTSLFQAQRKPKGAHRVHLQGVTYYANIDGATANEFRIYEYNPITQSETQVYQAASVDAVETDVTFVNAEGKITSGWGNDLIVRVLDAGSMADGCYMYSSYIAE